MNLDSHIEQTVAQGQRNLETWELIRNHCTHARVERMGGGVGLIEQQTGLPIGHFSLACEHSDGSRFGAWDLQHGAVDFYRRCCIDCPHRNPTNIPNLATLVASLDEEQAAALRLQAAREAEAEAQRTERRRKRLERTSGLSAAAQDVLRLLNRLDSESPSDEVAQELEVLVRAKVRDLPEQVVGEISQAVRELNSDALMPAIQTLIVNGRITLEPVEDAVKRAIVARQSAAALKVLLASEPTKLPERLRPLCQAIVFAGFVGDGPFRRRRTEFHSTKQDDVWMQALDVLIVSERDALLEEVVRMLQSGSLATRRVAAAAAGLIGKKAPDHMGFLSEQLIASLRSLAEVNEHRDHYNNPGLDIADALGVFLLTSPAEVGLLIEACATSLTDDQKKELFRSYSEACRQIEADSDKALVSMLFSICLKRLGNDWGPWVVMEAEHALDSLISHCPEALHGRTEVLLSALLRMSEDATPTPNPSLGVRVAQMRDSTAEMVGIRSVSECLETQARRQPLEVFDALEPFFLAAEVATDSTNKVRRRCIRILPAFVGTDCFEKTLPILYTCLLGPDQVERALAVEALGKISKTCSFLPLEISSAIPALLSDQYVVVHKAAVRAITQGLEVRVDDRQEVCWILLRLCTYYLKEENDGGFVLDTFRALCAIWTPEMGLHTVGVDFLEVIDLLASRLQDYDLRQFVDLCSFCYSETPGYIVGLLRILRDVASDDDFNDAHSEYRERLAQVEPSRLRPHCEALVEIAMSHVPRRPGRAFIYVEILQGLDLWEEAARLAVEIHSKIPASFEFSGRKKYSRYIETQSSLESAIRRADIESARSLSKVLLSEDEKFKDSGDQDEHHDRQLRIMRGEMFETLRSKDHVALSEAAAALNTLIADDWFESTRSCWLGFSRALLAASRLVQWQGGIRDALADSGRFLDSARMLAQEALEELEKAPPTEEILNLLRLINDASLSTHVNEALLRLQGMSLPVPFGRRRYVSRGPVREREVETPRVLAVSEISIDGIQVSETSVVSLNRLYELRLSLKLSAWPKELFQLSARFLSVSRHIEISDFQFTRPDFPESDEFWTVEGKGTLVMSAARGLGVDPLSFALMLEFLDQPSVPYPEVIGQKELRLWAFDDRQDYFTGIEQLDKRVAYIAGEVASNDVLGGEIARRNFVRFLVCLTRACVVLQRNDPFMVGQDVTEARFQKELLKLLQMDPWLGGRVHEGSEVSGGETDLLFENIVAELKVEKQNPVTEHNVSKYLGQATSYASGLGSQLGIACILDLSLKDHPIATPQNYLFWLEPRLHGIEIANYPTKIAVFVVNGSLPRPSSWKRVVETH